MAEVALQYYLNERREIDPLLPPVVGRVLELGCGAGNTMRWIRESRPVSFAAAVELFEDAAKKAEQVFDRVVVGDAEEGLARLDERDFDLALALDVLEHLLRPDRVVEALRDRLRPDGRILASIPHVGHFRVVAPLLRRGDWEYGDEGLLDRTHLRFFGEKQARALFEERGFVVERMEYVRTYPNLFAALGVGARKGRWYSRLLLERSPWRNSQLFKFQFLILARRA